MKHTFPYQHWLWLIPATIGGVVTLFIMFVLPPSRTIDNLLTFAFKTLPLVTAVIAIALFPKVHSWRHWLLLLGVIFYMGYVDSAFILQIDQLAEATAISEAAADAQFPAFYTFNLFVNSFTMLLALFAYRLGGGPSVRVLKLGFAAILVMLSGLNDLTMWVMYPWPGGERPFIFHWASHVEVFIGQPPNLYHMIAFLAVHLILATIILLLPLQRWLQRSKMAWYPPQPTKLKQL